MQMFGLVCGYDRQGKVHGYSVGDREAEWQERRLERHCGQAEECPE